MTLNFSDPAVFEQLPHDSYADDVVGVSFTVVSLATVVVFLRLYTRFIVSRQNGLDDYLIAVALLLAWGFVVCLYMGVLHGYGSHIWDIAAKWGPAGIGVEAKWLYITFVIYNGGLTTTKMALLAQYHRIIAVHDNMRIICLAVSLFVGIWCLIAFFWGAFQCTPVAKIWDPSIPGTCFPTSVLWYSTAVGNIVTDVMVFILPLPIVARLNLPTRQKFLVLGVLCLGFFTVILSFVRLKYLNQSEDFSYTTSPAAYWSAIELCSGIFCASVITLKPLAEKWFPWVIDKVRTPQQKSYATSTTTDLESSKRSHHRTKSDMSSASESRAKSRPDIYGEDSIDELARYSNQSFGANSEAEIMRPVDVPLADYSRKESQ